MFILSYYLMILFKEWDIILLLSFLLLLQVQPSIDPINKQLTSKFLPLFFIHFAKRDIDPRLFQLF